MTSVTNLEISSNDESSQGNANQRQPLTQTNTLLSKKYQRTLSYDDAFYNRPAANGKSHSKSRQEQEPRPRATQNPRNVVESGQNLYFGLPEAMPNYDAYRRAYDQYFSNSYIYAQPVFYPQPAAFNASTYSHYADPINQANQSNPIPDQRQRAQIDSIYRSTPLLNYSANSYFGWHQRPSAAPNSVFPPQTINRSNSSTCLDANDLLISSFPQGKQAFAAGSPEMNTATSSVLFDKETISPFFNDSRADRRRKRDDHGQQNGKCSPASLCLMSSEDSDVDEATLRRNRIKLCVIMTILVVIIAVLVAMGMAVYSQVKTQNSVVRLVRQYRSAFIVTGGRQLDYDADLLNPQSQSFKAKAKEFERKIDSIFRQSGLSSIYEGAEVTAFRFVIEPPGMEVQLNLKTKVSVQIQVSDLLGVLDEAIRHNMNGIFQDSIIDLKSLSVENQRITSTKS